MFNSIAAEADKLFRRPSTWLLGVVFICMAAIFNYVIPYLIYKNPPSEMPSSAVNQLFNAMLPEQSLASAVSGLPLFGGGFALILGAIVMGSEYGWDTFKTVFVHRSGRLNVLAGKLIMLIFILFIYVLGVFAVSIIGSYTLATIESAPIHWPSLGDAGQLLAAGWFILVMWAFFGVVLAALFRGTALSVGLGLVYVLVTEGTLGGFSRQSDLIANIYKALPGANAGSLASSMVPSSVGEGTPGMTSIVDGTQATIVLAVYTIGFILVTGWLIYRRDVA